MRSVPLTLRAVLVSAMLLTACGSQKADSHGGGGLSQTQVLPGDSSCGAQPSGTTAVPSTSVLPGDPSDLAKPGVKITGVSRGAPHCAEFEVTNSEIEPVT